MILSVALVIITGVAAARAIAHTLSNAPVGFEDQLGFHAIEAPIKPQPAFQALPSQVRPILPQPLLLLGAGENANGVPAAVR